MLKLNQYILKNTIIHSLDSRIKIILAGLCAITLFSLNCYIQYIIFFIFLLLAIKLSKIELKYIFRDIKPMLSFIVLVGILNTFFIKGQNYNLWGLIINLNGILITFRLLFLLLICLLMIMTTSPNEIAYGFGILLKPLKRLGLDENEISLMITIALRFIPTLFDEAERIIIAQNSRSVGRVKIKNKFKMIINFFNILIINCFKRAEELAIAMESRCFDGNMKDYSIHKIQKNDYYCVVITVVILLCTIVSSILI